MDFKIAITTPTSNGHIYMNNILISTNKELSESIKAQLIDKVKQDNRFNFDNIVNPSITGFVDVIKGRQIHGSVNIGSGLLVDVSIPSDSVIEEILKINIGTVESLVNLVESTKPIYK